MEDLAFEQAAVGAEVVDVGGRDDVFEGVVVGAGVWDLIEVAVFCGHLGV